MERRAGRSDSVENCRLVIPYITGKLLGSKGIFRMEIKVTLPWPPSVNRIWRRGRGRTYRDPKYVAWIKEAGWVVRAAKCRKVLGKFDMTLILIPPDKRLHDADNRIKAVLDLLQSMELIENDSLLRRLEVEKRDPDTIGRACVHVRSVT